MAPAAENARRCRKRGSLLPRRLCVFEYKNSFFRLRFEKLVGVLAVQWFKGLALRVALGCKVQG